MTDTRARDIGVVVGVLGIVIGLGAWFFPRGGGSRDASPVATLAVSTSPTTEPPRTTVVATSTPLSTDDVISGTTTAAPPTTVAPTTEAPVTTAPTTTIFATTAPPDPPTTTVPPSTAPERRFPIIAADVGVGRDPIFDALVANLREDEIVELTLRIEADRGIGELCTSSPDACTVTWGDGCPGSVTMTGDPDADFSTIWRNCESTIVIDALDDQLAADPSWRWRFGGWELDGVFVVEYYELHQGLFSFGVRELPPEIVAQID